MPIFQATPISNNADALGKKVQEVIASDNRYELPGHAGWVISYEGTSAELSARLGVTNPADPSKTELGNVILVTVGSYFGRGPTTMWEWLKTRFERQQ